MAGPLGKLGKIFAGWGVVGILATLADAVIRLSGVAARAFEHPLSAGQWTMLLAWCVFMLYVEGYRGFHLRFSPRLVARAAHLARRPTWLRGLLAPAFCAALFHASRRRVIASWCLVVGIVVLILLIRQLPQPWRGLIDCGVIVGLSVGALSILYWSAVWLTGRTLPEPADVTS